MLARVDYTGQVFGKLAVVSFAGTAALGSRGIETVWVCRCSACGLERKVRRSKLTRGTCRCSMIGNSNASKWGESGAYKTPEYAAWRRMILRCESPKVNDYHLYGGRGISVSEKWRHDFQAFLEDVGPMPGPRYTLDRINPDGHYEPGNVRWATWKTQGRNRRNTVMLTFRGETKPLREWAEESGVVYVTAYWRYKQGWPPEEILKVV